MTTYKNFRSTSLLTNLILSVVLSAVASTVPAFADDDAPAAAAPAPAAAPDGTSPSTTKKGRPYSDEAVKHYNRGVELHQSGFLNQAVKEYEDAITADSRMEEAWSNLGGILAMQKSYARASEAFERALSLQPGRPRTLNGYATVLYARGKIKEAKEKWEEAARIDPMFAPAYFNMGNALEGEKDTNGAINQFAKAIDIDGNMADAYYRLGLIYFKQKHLAQARALLARSIDLSPDAEFVKDARHQLVTIDSQLMTDSKNEHSSLSQVNSVAQFAFRSAMARS